MSKKNLIIVVAVVVGVAIGLWLFGGKSSDQKVNYQTATVNKGVISSSVTATGTVEPVTQVEVGTQVSGIVHKLYVDYNTVVRKGDIIAELDKINLENEYASKKSNLENAKTEYEYQLKNYTRIKALNEKKLISATEYETALYGYEKAKNSYDISKNDLAKAKTNLDYATITSPIDGIVLSRAVEEGQTVASSFNTPTLFIIANDLTDMRVIADVDEADIAGLTEGLRVSFSVDAYPNDIFEGFITQVRQQATVTNNVVTYEVVISAPNPDLKLKPGLTANVTIYTMEKADVLAVPVKALRFTPVKQLVGEDSIKDVPGQHKLWTREGNTFVAHAVEIGTSNGILTEIKSGINPGAVVITDIVMGQSNAALPTQGESSPFMPGRPGGKR
ncbi:efflux RND transporter periplasmic adaptor subunit [Bacteroides sp. 214]|uniref:efflux RND transporter periplasmic adaptor subunit n=1 Tax=Bacteroides sp. 214 TaxID=2302935 RepID=UPI0013D84A28|nr:efflux RND transporter periplasmic adaptor subunit [Bacteroides sp. 214]NDW12972.1 efflux RND transporter periplasmic adaptor subunit [Bacteroides sp. 214]